MPALLDLVGHRFGRLVIIGRAQTISTSGGQPRTRWVAACDCGRRAVVRAAQLRSGRTTSCGCANVENARRMGRSNRRAIVKYERAHARIRDARGPARMHRCVDCGARSTEWSYVGACPAELTAPRGMPYCLHPDHYQPRCGACHTAYDRERGADGRYLPRAEPVDAEVVEDGADQ